MKAIRFEARTLAEAESLLSAAYGDIPVFDFDGRPPHLALERLDLGAVCFDRIVSAVAFETDTPGGDTIFVGSVRRGRIQRTSGDDPNEVLAGETRISGHASPARLRFGDGVEFETVTLDPRAFDDLLDADAVSGAALRFTDRAPISPRADAQWHEAADLVRRHALTSPGFAAQPLVLGAAVRLLAATLLSTFPNTAHPDLVADDRPDAHAGVVRRAIAHMEDNVDRDLSITEVAAAARVSTRALQLAFRRHRDETPLDYLRGIRLEYALDDLLAADPASTTVAAVAARWGFGDAGRFARRYRERFGESPGNTLRQ